MIELRLIPGNIVVAGKADGGETKSGMGRLGGGGKIGLVAIIAIGADIGIPLRMTAIAIDGGVSAVQREDWSMLIRCIFPTGCYWLVTILAVAAEFRLDMIGIGRLRKIIGVTAPAIDRGGGKLSLLLPDMTRPTIGNFVYPQ
jgi:hypothetical protein